MYNQTDIRVQREYGPWETLPQKSYQTIPGRILAVLDRVRQYLSVGGRIYIMF